MMLDQLLIRMVTNVPLGTAGGVGRLLEALGHSKRTIPTHWGMDERARNPFDREEMIAAIAGDAGTLRIPGLRRNKAPRYKAYFSAKDEGLSGLLIDFRSDLRPSVILEAFELGDRLAEAMQAEFGSVHMIWRLGDESQDYSASGIINAHELQKFGLKPPSARTWYGPHLVDLLGRERLADTGAPLQDTPWGGVRLDLIQSPWTGDFATLSARQVAIMKHLRPSGIFGDYSEVFHPRSGPQWQPIPSSEGSAGDRQPARPSGRIDHPALAPLREAISQKRSAGNVDLSGLDLRKVDLTGLAVEQLVASGTRFDYALLTNVTWIEADLSDANLQGAHLENAALGLSNLDRAQLNESCLRHVSFTIGYCANASLEDADLAGAELSGSLFFGSRFDRASLRDVKAESAAFTGASFIGADLRDGCFKEASFKDADLSNANLEGCDLTGADFQGAKLVGARWAGAALDGARFDAGAAPELRGPEQTKRRRTWVRWFLFGRG